MKSIDIYDEPAVEDEPIDFLGMDFSDFAENDPAKNVFSPVQAEISPDAQVGLMSNSFLITKGTWREVSQFITDNWPRFNGVYEIVDEKSGGGLHKFTIAR